MNPPLVSVILNSGLPNVDLEFGVIYSNVISELIWQT